MKNLRSLVFVGLFAFLPQFTLAQRNSWVATWAASPQSSAPNPKQPLLNIENQTVRERVRISIGGAKVCIRLSNEYGSAPLLIGAATIAIPTDPSSIHSGTIHSITFGGQDAVTIPAGAPILSDPITFPVASGAEVTISLYFPKRVATPTVHYLALKRAVVSQHGDFTHAENIADGTPTNSSISLSAILVPAQPPQRLVVAFGDSVTDGDQSAVDADRNWPSDLVKRMQKSGDTPQVAIVNAGISGNRLLSDCFMPGAGCFSVSALARFDRDVLSLPGVTHVILLEGLNDIGFPGAKLGADYLADSNDVRSPDEIIAGYHQLISRAHCHGIKMFGATITPYEGVTVSGYYSESKEVTRQAVNKWIRSSGEFDGVIDFDAALRDPDHPSELLPRFASKDNLHPNDAGYEAMANAIDLKLFK
jgi:lysophospholipase L1-like esterase